MTTTNFAPFSAGTAERLMKSADALDFALQGAKKSTTATAAAAAAGVSRSGFDFGSFDIFAGSDLSASLFDDWLANDLQQAGFTGHDEPMSASSSSDSDSSSSNSPRISNESDSPVVGFDSIASDAELIQSAGLDTAMALFPEVGFSAPAAIAPVAPIATAAAPVLAPATPLLHLTPEAVQQAAAALNIPWSKSLETAVLAQSLLASLPLALQLPLKPTAVPVSPAIPAAQPLATSPAMSPKQEQRAMSPSSPILAAAVAVSPSPEPASPVMSTTPRPSLSILSSTQALVSDTSSVKATLYKSAYRSAALPMAGMKRDRKFSDPPSVLEGKDLSEMDEVALKRAKNTDAARRSRHKKLVRMEGLEQRVAELEVENSMFESKLNEVELERSLLADKDQMQQARIQELETMLATMREKLYQ